MSVARVRSVTIVGLEGVEVFVEVDIGLGLPNFTIVGLADKAVEEAKERVRSAFKNSHLSFPQHRVTVNLAPADLKKYGTAYDLPIAVGILLADDLVPSNDISKAVILGELSLNGEVRPVPGVLPGSLFAEEKGWSDIYVPIGNIGEASLVRGLKTFGVTSLRDLYLHIRGEKLIQVHPPLAPVLDEVPAELVDMQHIRGQYQVKRALEIAAAGGHNILLSGPPGSGKTLLAKALTGILPAMSIEEVFEVTKIYSIAGLLTADIPLITRRPYRAAHHSASLVSLIGGGQWPRPGEISLAHRGVLFLDELPEFPRGVLESLRQPLEDGVVTVTRAAGSVQFPAEFTLLATQNPCPCGYLYDTSRQCSCSAADIRRYHKRLSGPLLDRIDLHVSVPRVETSDLVATENAGDASSIIRGRVEAARALQRKRYSATKIQTNSEMSLLELRKFGAMEPSAATMLQSAVDRLGLSARGYHRTIKVARTIADLANAENIGQDHIAETLQFREKHGQ